MKSKLVGISLILAGLLGLWIFYYLRYVPNSTIENPPTDQTAATSTARTDTPPQTETATTTPETPKDIFALENKQLEETGAQYTIKAAYPQFLNLDEPAKSLFNSSLESEILKWKKTVLEYAKDADDKVGPGTYNNTFEAIRHGDFLSVVYTGSVYTGGAHPMDTHMTYIFSPKEGKSLAIYDLFSQDDFLQQLSSICIVRFSSMDISDADWIKSGCAPKLDNFKYAYLADDGLHLIIPAYQVAAGAAGPQEITIPGSQLKGYKY